MEDGIAFSETGIFQYNKARKIVAGALLILGAAAACALVLSYFIYLSDSSIVGIGQLKMLASHMMSSISSSTVVGIIYASFIGGLFFVVLPNELLFAKFAASGKPFILVLAVYLAGTMAAFAVNYIIGAKLSGLSKKLISARKFYAIKVKLNKYGSALVYFFNALPLPSQPLAAMLGVFKYNTTKFYVWTFLGELTKCLAIAGGVYYFS